MADLEILLSELLNIIDELNLNIGNRKKIKNEISKLDNNFARLNEIQKAIESELGFEKIKNVAMGALPFLGTVASFFIPGGFLVFEAAQKLAIEAAILVQNPPHPLNVWKKAQNKWKQAINLLENIPEGTFIFHKAKEKLSIYETNYTAISTRVKD